MSRLQRFLFVIAVWLSFAAPSFAASSNVNSLTSSPAIVGTQLFYCPIGATTDYKCTAAQIAAYNYSLMSGDCTTSGTGAITCLSTNGTAFGALATITPGTGVAAGLRNAADGSGSPVFSSNPTLTTPALGTPSAVNLANGTGLPISGVNGLGTGVGTALGLTTNATGGIATIATSSPTANGCVEWTSSGLSVQTSACGSGSGAVSSVSNSDSTLTISPTTGAVVASLNLTNANTWTGAQTLSGGATVAGSFTATGLVTNSDLVNSNMTVFGTPCTLGSTCSPTVALTNLATEAANTVVGNGTGSSAAPTALSMPSCSGASNALIWTSATGFGCNTISGGGSVNNIATDCPVTTLSPSGGTITFPNGFGEVAETASYAPTASQCGALFTSTGSGITATLPTIGGGGGDVESPYGIVIKNADTAGNSMTVSGGGTNINYNGSSSSSITLNAGQSTLLFVNAANNLWQATSTATGTVPTWHPGYISGDWYSINTSPALATGSAQTASTVYCTLQQLNVTETFKSMGAYFSTGVATGNVTYAMFNASAGRPSTLIDYAGPAAAPTSAGASTIALHNTTDTLTPADYFFCETQDNTTGIINSIYTAGGAYAMQWVGASAPLSAGVGVGSNAGISCTAASTCGTGYAAWSAGAFTWVSFSVSNPTWTTTGLSTVVPLIEVQAN